MMFMSAITKWKVPKENKEHGRTRQDDPGIVCERRAAFSRLGYPCSRGDAFHGETASPPIWESDFSHTVAVATAVDDFAGVHTLFALDWEAYVADNILEGGTITRICTALR